MDSVEYTKWWLEIADHELQICPTSELHFLTNGKWISEINKVYFHPETLEEYDLRHKVHGVLLTVFQNVMRKAEALPQMKWNEGDCLDVVEACYLALCIGRAHPLLDVQMKIRINNLAGRFNETVERLKLS